MPVLREEQKLFIVQQLAMFDRPEKIREAVKEEFDIDVPRQQIRNYNPEQVNVAEKWKRIFDDTRRAFVDSTAAIPIAQLSVRLRLLDRLQQKAETMGNYALAAELLAQAARDVGGMFTNRQRLEHSGPDGKPICPPPLPTQINVVLVKPREVFPEDTAAFRPSIPGDPPTNGAP
ncbi:MAG: DUF2280 domain-containing protein [Gemmatimonadaceae bacterium]|nr:DUF2280 domain-containing protein [Gemmatimonadaceae bacterium]